MARTTQKSTPKRSKPASAASRSRSATANRSRSTAAKPSPSRAASAESRSSSANGGGAPAAARKAISKIGAPALAGGAAIAGIIGGVALGARALPRKRRFPAINGLDIKKLDMKKLDPTNVDIKKARKQVGRASKQFGEFTRELRKAGEGAERIGDALK